MGSMSSAEESGDARAGSPPAGDGHSVRITDPAVMRALAHPARLAVLDHLAGSGRTATATECARIAGLSPSAMSYHLRALAKLGMIEEAPSGGDGRERRWRAAHTLSTGYLVESADDATPDEQMAEQSLVAAWVATEDALLRRWLDRMQSDPLEWRRASSVAGIRIMVTSAELTDITRQVFDLLRPYRERQRAENPPPGARRVSVQYRAVPLEEP